MPADNSPFALGSVDGHALQIDELKGTKPTEKIDLSNKGLGVASVIIIASCIKENGVLKELKCAAARVFACMSMPIDTPALSPCPLCSSLTFSSPLAQRAQSAFPPPHRSSPLSLLTPP
jgi:hypothetical protein